MMPALFISTSSLGKSAFTRAANVAICAGSAASLWIVWSFGYFAFHLIEHRLTTTCHDDFVAEFDELKCEGKAMPAEPPVMRMVRFLRIIEVLSPACP
jgi:hypothetical protein